MDIIGNWKLKKAGIFDPELGFQMKTVEEIMQMEDSEEIQQTKEMINTTMRINEDGTLQIRILVPESAIEEAKAAGEEIPLDEDGTAVVQEMPWKIENGEIFYKIEEDIEEIDGEPVDPWKKAEFDEDGLLVFFMMAFEKE
ncbi:MAG: hypothetical protein IKI93_02510 [Clostridia bacterium]|nr:hypothetical protein [Clostridia bacterium]